MNSINTAFGQHLKKLRIQKNLSQEKLAEAADISVSFLGGIERGKKSPTLETINKLSKALDIPITVLMSFGTESTGSKDTKLKELIEKFANDIENLYK